MEAVSENQFDHQQQNASRNQSKDHQIDVLGAFKPARLFVLIGYCHESVLLGEFIQESEIWGFELKMLDRNFEIIKLVA